MLMLISSIATGKIIIPIPVSPQFCHLLRLPISPHGRAQPQNQLQCCPHLVYKGPPVRDVQQQTVLQLSTKRENSHKIVAGQVTGELRGSVTLKICHLILGNVAFGLSRAIVSYSFQCSIKNQTSPKQRNAHGD